MSLDLELELEKELANHTFSTVTLVQSTSTNTKSISTTTSTVQPISERIVEHSIIKEASTKQSIIESSIKQSKTNNLNVDHNPIPIPIPLIKEKKLDLYLVHENESLEWIHRLPFDHISSITIIHARRHVTDENLSDYLHIPDTNKFKKLKWICLSQSEPTNQKSNFKTFHICKQLVDCAMRLHRQSINNNNDHQNSSHSMFLCGDLNQMGCDVSMINAVLSGEYSCAQNGTVKLYSNDTNDKNDINDNKNMKLSEYYEYITGRRFPYSGSIEGHKNDLCVCISHKRLLEFYPLEFYERIYNSLIKSSTCIEFFMGMIHALFAFTPVL
jgi:hypothetical protein